MALPTLRSYYKVHRPKSVAEGRIAHRRAWEEDKRKWDENSRYFSTSTTRAVKQEAWASSDSFQGSMNTYQSRTQAEERRRNLQQRRERLRELLRKENNEYEVELRSISPNHITNMKERADHLRTQREKERRKLADERMYEHWRSNCPELREVESQEMEKHVISEWARQREQKQQELETARKEKERYELELEQERLAALKLQEEEEERQKQEQREHSEVLKSQMRQIKEREKEAALLEHQQAKLIQDQLELQKAEDSRKLMKERQKKSEFRRFLIHQCKAQLRRKSQQIQESLELDLALLNELADKEKEDQVLQTARRERARADAVWMKEMVARQLETEKQREMELDNLYREEAARLWQKRETEWEKERVARERLMKEVFEDRQNQINLKMKALKEEQGRSIEERERLMEEMELEVEKNKAEATARQREAEIRVQDWHEQVKEKTRQLESEQSRYQREVEEERLAEEAYTARVWDEERMITSRGFTPKTYGRKKIAWN